MKKDKRKTRPVSIFKRIKAKFSKTKPIHFNPYHYHPRHLARSVAKHNMAKAGMEHINSMFSYNWLNYVRAK